MEPSKKHLLQWVNLVGFIATVVVNMLANALPLNGKNTGQLSDNIPNLFVPVGFTFSIWGVIYVLLFLFSWYQGRDLLKKEKEDIPFLGKIGWFFATASAGNIAWIFAWHWELVPLSMVFMGVLLASLLALYVRLGIGLPSDSVTRKERNFIHVPISVYLGWITVATIANVVAVLVVSRAPGDTTLLGIDDATWTVLVLIVGLAITALMLLIRKDVAYSLVIIWAYLGIALKRLDPAFAPEPAIVAMAFVAIAIIGILIALVKLLPGRKAKA